VKDAHDGIADELAKGEAVCMPPRHEPQPRLPGREDVLRLARNNVVVAQCVGLWRAGTVTFEEAVCQAVLTLAELNRHMAQEIRETKLMAPPAPIKVVAPVGKRQAFQPRVFDPDTKTE